MNKKRLSDFDTRRKAIGRVIHIVLVALAEMPRGEAPEGHLYAALMHGGCTLETFNGLRDVLVDQGLAKRGPMHLLQITEKGRQLVAGGLS